MTSKFQVCELFFDLRVEKTWCYRSSRSNSMLVNQRISRENVFIYNEVFTAVLKSRYRTRLVLFILIFRQTLFIKLWLALSIESRKSKSFIFSNAYGTLSRLCRNWILRPQKKRNSKIPVMILGCLRSDLIYVCEDELFARSDYFEGWRHQILQDRELLWNLVRSFWNWRELRLLGRNILTQTGAIFESYSEIVLGNVPRQKCDSNLKIARY